MPLRGTSASRAIRGFLEDSSPTAIVVAALRAGVLATANMLSRAVVSFAAIMVALLVPCVSSGAGKNTQSDQSAPSFAGTINGHTIQVEFVFGKFDPKKRAVTKRKGSNGAGETSEYFLINGKRAVGVDNQDPRRGSGHKAVEVIKEIRITWGGKPIKVPEALFDHVIAPDKETNFAKGQKPRVLFSPEPSGEALIVEMMAGEGSAVDWIYWLFRKDGHHEILGKMFFSLDP